MNKDGNVSISFLSDFYRLTRLTAMSFWSGSSSYRWWLPTRTPSLLADWPSQQWPAVMTRSGATREPPHMRLPPTPPRSRAIWWGNSPGLASVPPTMRPPPRDMGVEMACLERRGLAAAVAARARKTAAALMAVLYWPHAPHPKLIKTNLSATAALTSAVQGAVRSCRQLYNDSSISLIEELARQP